MKDVKKNMTNATLIDGARAHTNDPLTRNLADALEATTAEVERLRLIISDLGECSCGDCGLCFARVARTVLKKEKTVEVRTCVFRGTTYTEAGLPGCIITAEGLVYTFGDKHEPGLVGGERVGVPRVVLGPSTNINPPEASQVEAARVFLRKYGIQTKTVRKILGSYGWKHVAEKQMGEYISNGAFILAAVLEGIKVAPQPFGSLNAWFALSRQLKDVV